MTGPNWRQLGFLTPDAPDCQREVWALASLWRTRLAELIAALATQTAEPTWHRALEEQALRAVDLAQALAEEAGGQALAAVGDDALVREFDGALGEVVASGHVPSLLVTGYAVLGEQALAPITLLDGVVGPHARLLSGRMLSAEQHQLLGRLAGIAHLAEGDVTALKRLLRHLHGQMAAVNVSMRQTWHVLGVDGELLDETCRDTARRALDELGLRPSRHDLAVFGVR